MASLQAIVFMFGVISVMGTWDGLVRRHIRLSFDPLGMFVLLRGIPAILVGLICGACLLFCIYMEVVAVQETTAACSSLLCTFQQNVLVLFTAWQSSCIVLLCSFVFVYWLWGAFDLKGPYRRQMLAPGVWYREKEVIEQVSQQLQAHHLPPLSDEQIIRAAQTLIINLKTYAALQPSQHVTSGQLDPKALADIHLEINPISRRDTARTFRQAHRIMATTILRYYLALHDRALAKWPWMRKLLGY